MKNEKGRTLLELLLTLTLIGVIGIGIIKGYHYIVSESKTLNTAKMIKTLALERQNSILGGGSSTRRHVKGPHSDLYIEDGTAGNYSKYFWVETTLRDEDFCKALKKSNLIQADLIEVDGVADGTCHDNAKLVFYFKKKTSGKERLTWIDEEGTIQKCPEGSLTCNEYGEATACEDGYYLSEGDCASCGAHVATCTDEETPTSCKKGYELLWGECVLSPQMCTMDSDCDVCASCDTETGRCQGECDVPTQRCYKDSDCGDNDCVICDTEEHSCHYACTKVEYLESTGSQWIDTGIYGNLNTKIETRIYADMSVTHYAIVGDFTTSTSAITVPINLGNAGLYSRFGNKAITTGLGHTTGTYKIYVDKSGYYSDDVKRGSFDTTTAFTTTNTMMLFGFEGLGRNYLVGKMYYCKIWDDTTLVGDFIPVISPKGNCMFDKVSQKLFCNQGNGEDFRTD